MLTTPSSLFGNWPDILVNDHDPLIHPALTEPRSKEAWRRYVLQCDPVVPARLLRQQYERLSIVDLDQYNRARHQHHSKLVIVETDELVEFRNNLMEVIGLNMNAQAGARSGLVVSGPAGVGKSTTLKTVLRSYELFLRAEHPEYFARVGDDFVPVAYLLMPHKVFPKAMLAKLIEYYGLPHRSSHDTVTLRRLAVQLVERCGTQVLVIDDLHFLNVNGNDGADANNLMKEILNETGVTVVAAGIDLDHSKLFPATAKPTSVQRQNGSRFALQRLAPAPCKTKADKQAWVSTIAAFESSLCLLDHEQGTLPGLYEYLHHRTGGMMAGLSQLIRKGAHQAIRTGRECIDEAMLKDVRVDITNEARVEAARKSTRNPAKPSRGQVA